MAFYLIILSKERQNVRQISPLSKLQQLEIFCDFVIRFLSVLVDGNRFIRAQNWNTVKFIRIYIVALELSWN